MALLIQGQDYIVLQFDGNNNDRDDISALPVSASLTNAAGLQGNLYHWLVGSNNDIGPANFDLEVSRNASTPYRATRRAFINVLTYD